MVRRFVPTSTILNSGFTSFGEASPHLAVDEGVDTPDDGTTFIVVAAGATANCTLGLDAIVPAPAIAATHKARVRARTIGIATLQGALEIQLLDENDGGTLVGTTGLFELTGDTAYTVYEVDLGLSSPHSDYTGLSLQVIANGDMNNRKGIRITAIELEIPSEAAVAGNFSGSSSTSGAITGNGALSGAVSGTSATSGNLVGTGALLGSANGTSATSGTISGLGSLTGAVAGTSSTSGSISGLGKLAGNTSGVSSFAGVVLAYGALSATFVGLGDFSGALKGIGALSGSYAGSSSFSAALFALGHLSASFAGQATLSANLQGLVSISGSFAGVSSFVGALAMLRGAFAGTSDWSGLLENAIIIGEYEFVHNTIRTALGDTIESPLSVSVLYDDEQDEHAEAWISARIELDDTKQVTTGAGNTSRKSGVLRIKIHTRLEMGDGTALELADQIKSAFREVDFSGVIFRVPSIEDQYATDRWWIVELVCPFYRFKNNAPVQGTAPATDVSDFAEIANIIRLRFKNQIATPNALPTHYDNAPFEAPDNALWCSVSVLFGETFKRGLGNPSLYRTPGVMVASLHTPIETGDQALLSLADKIVRVFEAVTDQSVTFKTPSVQRVGRTGKWWQINVTCPFYSDQLEV